MENTRPKNHIAQDALKALSTSYALAASSYAAGSEQHSQWVAKMVAVDVMINDLKEIW